ncbi:MAG: CHAP domain-containing protein [Chloroflexota bacterium]
MKHELENILFASRFLRRFSWVCPQPWWPARLLACLLCVPLFFHFQPPAAALRTAPFLSITNGNDEATQPSISADGRFVAFASNASNLVPGDANGVADIFVYDRQRGEMRLISVSSTGMQANALSARPAISADGRVVAFESLASNLVAGDTNGVSDIFVHDLLAGETSRVSVSVNGEEGNGWSEKASISGNGHVVAFVSAADNLFPGDANAAWDAFTYDRLTGFLQRISIGPNGEDANGETRAVTINPQGTTVTFTSSATNLLLLADSQSPGLYSYNRETFRTVRLADAQAGDAPTISTGGQWIAFLSPDSLRDRSAAIFDQLNQTQTVVRFALPLTQQAISSNGQVFYAVGTADGEVFNLYGYDVASAETWLLAEAVENVRPAVSRDGQALAFVQRVDGLAQIQVIDRQAEADPTYVLAGRVLGPLGDPLGQVSVDDGRGNTAVTDRAGVFFLGGLPAGRTTLTPSKAGFAFGPESITVLLEKDMLANGTVDEIRFTYVYSDVLKEARLDIGMPYDHRCEEGPDCQGDFHGYAAGQCTNLVMDAFTWGAQYNIKLALWRDIQAHPEHFYQTGNASDAYDMWRYFSYSRQVLPHEAPYQVGDLVFFDWTDDGEINHVALVSKVDAGHRPTWMIEASGVIDGNPSGLAAELPWRYLHEHSVRGHARWNGLYEAPVVGVAPPLALQVGLGSTGARLRLGDFKGGTLSAVRNTIPNGWFFDLTWEQNASVLDPLAHSTNYFAVIWNPTREEMPYYFVAQVAQGWDVYDAILYTDRLPPGGVRLVPLRVAADGTLTPFTWTPRGGTRPPR